MNHIVGMRKPSPPRQTLWDALEPDLSRNIYCNYDDLTNEASVESFFVLRLLKDLGYKDAQIKTKEAIETRVIGKGHKKTNYKPDFVLSANSLPCCVVDAKGTDESPAAWVHQCSNYCLSLNQDYPAGENPVRYFVLTNGVSTDVYPWDSNQPTLSLAFADFDYASAKYQALKNLLAEKTVRVTVAPATPKSPDFILERPSSEQARKLFSTCHQIIWKSEGSGPAPAFMEFVKLMFVKLWYDHKLRDDPATKDRFTSEPLTKLPKSAVIFSSHWIEEREKEGVANPVDSILFENLRKDIEHKVIARKKKRLFNKDERINLKSHTIKQVVSKLERVDMFGIDEDLNGRLFETFLSATMRGRDLGQFFTPRSVVKMMTRIADLQVTPKHQDKVLDACCGSGGFLIEALTIMRNDVRANRSLSEAQKADLIEKIANECLYGVDFGKDPPLARIARINMYLHGDGGSRIYFADALDKVLKIEKDADAENEIDINELREMLQHPEEPLQFDVVLTNPPFSMAKEHKNEFERRILSQYVLAKRTPDAKALRSSLRSSIMFMERYADLLRPKGKLITVIDDTLLASDMEVFQSVRNYVRRHFFIRAIVSLPGDAFRRSGARVKTSVLVLEKKEDQSQEQPHCLGFFSSSIGIDDLTPRAQEAEIKEARSKAEAETQELLDNLDRYLKGKPIAVSTKCVLLAPERISDRLDLKFCVPQSGRLVEKWQEANAEIKKFGECVQLAMEEVIPSQEPDRVFQLLAVSYEGRCRVERKQKGSLIKAPSMCRVKSGQLVFSTIRATDGAIGIVPPEMNGALVSDSYLVFDVDTDYDTAYLWAIVRSHEIRADMQSSSQGSGRYVTNWDNIRDVVLPWLPEEQRRKIGKDLLDAWELERQVKETQQKAARAISALGVESEESITRFKASKAPT